MVLVYLNEPGALDCVPPAVVSRHCGVSQQEVSVERSPVRGEAVCAGPGGGGGDGGLDGGAGVHVVPLAGLNEHHLGFAGQRGTVVRREVLPDLVDGVGAVVAVDDALVTVTQDHH